MSDTMYSAQVTETGEVTVVRTTGASSEGARTARGGASSYIASMSWQEARELAGKLTAAADLAEEGEEGRRARRLADLRARQEVTEREIAELEGRDEGEQP